MRRRELRLESAVGRASPRGQVADKHTILTIRNDGSGNALCTTAAAHGLSGGEVITITGTAHYNSIYDGGAAEWAVVSPTRFTLTAAYFDDENTGMWH